MFYDVPGMFDECSQIVCCISVVHKTINQRPRPRPGGPRPRPGGPRPRPRPVGQDRNQDQGQEVSAIKIEMSVYSSKQDRIEKHKTRFYEYYLVTLCLQLLEL